MPKRPNFANSPAFSMEIVNSHGPEDIARCASDCEDASKILDYLWLGSWRDAENAEKMKSRNITHVLNVAKELPPTEEQEAMNAIVNVLSKQIPLEDNLSQDILPYFTHAFEFIDLARESNGRVLVHCRRGISRSPAIVVGYLMFRMQYTYDQSVEFVKSRRQCISLNLAFRHVLEEYDPHALSRQESHRSEAVTTPEYASSVGGYSATTSQSNAPNTTFDKFAPGSPRILNSTGSDLGSTVTLAM